MHPAPEPGEALSSWLYRVARAFDLTVESMLLYGLEDAQALSAMDLDVDPPAALVEALARKTGAEASELNAMTLAGWVPWLMDSLEVVPSAFDTYVRQFSVLLPPGKASKQPVRPWRAWMPDQPMRRACRMCVAGPDRSGLKLMWQLPLLLSCPAHHCLLEPCLGIGGDRIFFQDNQRPRRASTVVEAMDRRTNTALRTGHVQLPRREIHAAVWFRLLRTLLDELSTPANCWGTRATDLRLVWSRCGLPVRAGQAVWRPYEALPWAVQAQILQAAATAIDLLHTGDLTGRGRHATLFTPHLDVPVHDGRRRSLAKPNGPHRDRWAATYAAANEAVSAAREDPVHAQALLDMLIIWCRTPQAEQQIIADLELLGIPTRDLSRNYENPTVHVP